MIVIIVVAILGILIGMNIRQEMLVQRYNKTLEEVDDQVRKELAYYKNLSESLKNDLEWEKHKNKDKE